MGHLRRPGRPARGADAVGRADEPGLLRHRLILPTYAPDRRRGASHPGLLAARLVQGLSLGGEYGASATYMSEMAGKARRGFWSSFQYITLIGGQVAALAGAGRPAARALPRPTWRPGAGASPSPSAACLAIVVFWIRTGLDETGAYLAAKAAGAVRAAAP